MPAPSQKSVLWTILVCSVILFLTTAFYLPGKITSGDEGVDYDRIKLMIPDAAKQVDVDSLSKEIAKLIVLPEAQDFDNQRLSEVWESLYSDEIEDLELSALEAYDDEFDEDDLEDFLKEEFDGFDSLVSVSEDDDEEVISIISLGLKDVEDKEVIITKEYKIRYELDDSDDRIKDRVFVTAIITFDEDDGFEAEINFSL